MVHPIGICRSHRSCCSCSLVGLLFCTPCMKKKQGEHMSQSANKWSAQTKLIGRVRSN